MEKLKRRKRIAHLKDGETVDDIFVVKIKKEMGKYQNGYRFNLILSDDTGESIDYVYWGPSDEGKVGLLFGEIEESSAIHITGKVGTYRGRLQLSSNESDTFRVLEEGEYEEGAFIRQPLREIGEMRRELEILISSIKDEHLSHLLRHIFTPETLERFSVHPGAIQHHHNWKGGLMQHALEVAGICCLQAEQHPRLDRDLLITGALIHDIGKIHEMEMKVRIRGTIRGQLLGHITISVIMASEAMEKAGTPNELREKILHMIVSHHGRLEYGSIKEPMFPEALALYYADEMSAKVAEMIDFVEIEGGHTQDRTKYSKYHGRNILLR